MFRVPPTPFSLTKPHRPTSNKSTRRDSSRRLSSSSIQSSNRRNVRNQSAAAVELEETAPTFEHEYYPTSPEETRFVEENARRRHSHLSKRTKNAAPMDRGPLAHLGEVITNSQDDEAQQDPAENVVHNAYSIYHEDLQHSSGDIIHDPRKRKRHSKATENDESRSKKHKKRRTQISKLTDFAGEEEALDTIGAPVSRNYDLGVSPEKSLFGMNSGNQVLSKKERKELKRRRKEERQRKREESAERKKTKERAMEMQSQDEDGNSDHEIILDDQIELTNEIPSTYEANYSTGGLSQEIPLNQDPAGKPSRKSRKRHDLEIAATQEHQSPIPRSTPRSSPEGTPLPEPKRRSLLSLKHNSTKKKTKQSTPTLALDRSSDVPIAQSNESINDAEAYAAEPDIISAVEGDEGIEMTSAQTPEPSGNQNGHVVGLSSAQRSQSIPRGKRRRQVSAQRIYDSSADEEPPEPPPTSKERKRKVGDLVKHHKPDPTSAETDEEREDGVGHGEFTSEEDERLRKVVSQYRQVSLSPQNSPDT